MKVVVVYVYPVFGGEHDELAARFACCYRDNLPVTPHELMVVSNGGEPTQTMREVFKDIPCWFLVHDDTGWDIGAYRKAAREIPCDLMIFFGGSSYVRGKRWLERMVEASNKRGLALYGTMGNQGDAKVNVTPHVRTTGFWCHPSLVNQYPHPVTSETESRYLWEHGPNGFSHWVKSKGLKVWVVSWESETPLEICDSIPNGWHKNRQEALIVGDKLTCEPYYPYP